jgi:hypothetical protein
MKTQSKISLLFAFVAMALIVSCERDWNNPWDENRDPHKIGDTYEGGIIFYLDGKGGGLVCTPYDQSTDAEWGCYETMIGGTSTAKGSGVTNTAAIVAGCSQSGIAARICNDLVFNGYSDWFLPSKDELNLMFQNLRLAGIGGFADFNYWSSSEYSSNFAWKQPIHNIIQYPDSKNSNGRVRAVRAF